MQQNETNKRAYYETIFIFLLSNGSYCHITQPSSMLFPLKVFLNTIFSLSCLCLNTAVTVSCRFLNQDIPLALSIYNCLYNHVSGVVCLVPLQICNLEGKKTTRNSFMRTERSLRPAVTQSLPFKSQNSQCHHVPVAMLVVAFMLVAGCD